MMDITPSESTNFTTNTTNMIRCIGYKIR